MPDMIQRDVPTETVKISELPVAAQANPTDQLETNQSGNTVSITVAQIVAVLDADLSAYAKLDSPVFVGDPQAPTPATGDNDSSIATTAYVKANFAALPTTWPPSGAAGGDLSSNYPNPNIKANVALNGAPTTSTPPTTDNTQRIATTAFVKAAITASGGGSGGAPGGPAGGDLAGTYPNPTIKASVVLTGNPTAPTPPAGDSDFTVPTTHWVQGEIGTAIAALPAPPTSLPPSGAAGGALAGTYPYPTLVGGPLSNYALTSSIPTTLPPSGAAGGDLSGTYPAPKIKPSATDGHVLTTVGGVSTWAAAASGGGTGDFCANQTSSFPTISTTFTTLILTQVYSGNAGLWYSTSTGRYTPPTGRFSITASFSGACGAASHYYLQLRKNGAVVQQSVSTEGTATWFGEVSVSLTVDANGTDFFDIQGQSTGGAVTPNSLVFSAFPLTGLQGPPGVAGVLASPTGVIVDFAGSVAPTGWYLCDGASKNTTTDAALFAVIGYTYGGSGASFSLPDLRGRVTAGPDGGAGRLTTATMSSVAVGGVGGEQIHTLSGTEIPSHTHGMIGGYLNNGGAGTVWTYFQATGPITPLYTYSQTDVAGGGGGHNNVQPTLIMNKIIKT